MAIQLDSDIGAKVWSLVNGEQPFFTQRYHLLKVIGSAIPGQAVVVKLSDPISFGSDARSIALVWDDAVLDNTGIQNEGESAAYSVNQSGNSLSVWIDSEVPAQVTLMSAEDARREVNDDNKSLPDKVRETVASQRDDNMLILGGVGVIVVILIGALAYALPKTKITVPLV